MNGERFTAYLSTGERAGLRELAGELGSSENYVVKVALRALLQATGREGFPVPRWALVELQDVRTAEPPRQVSA